MNDPYTPMAPYAMPRNNYGNYSPSALNNTIVWVQGEAGANAYPVAPNSVVWLMDSNEAKLYVKRTDASGRYYPLEKYKLVPIEESSVNPEYVTMDQLDAKLNELTKKFVIRKPRKENENV